jgi:hypothetical protein
MTQQIRTKTRDASLIDEVRESPVDEALGRQRRRRLAIVLLVAVAILLVAGFLSRRRSAVASMRAPLSPAVSEVVSS